MTTAYWNWGPFYAARVQSLLDGTWEPRATAWQDFTNDGDAVVGLQEFDPAMVDGTIRTEAGTEKAWVQADPARPFVGPVRDVNGVIKIPQGTALTDVELDRLCWFVEGVISTDNAYNVVEPALVPAECQGDR